MTQVISFIQQKGGAGKTTLLTVLAGIMAKDNANVLILDTDYPQHGSVMWAKKDNSNVAYITVKDEAGVENAIETHASKYDVILIDTVGANTSIVSYIIAESDLVIIPFDTTMMDVECAVATAKSVGRLSKHSTKATKIVFIANRLHKTSNIGKENIQRLEQMHPKYKSDGKRFHILFGCRNLQGFKEMFTHGGLPQGVALREGNAFVASLQMNNLIDYYKD